MTSTQQQTSKRSVDEYGYPLFLDIENDPIAREDRMTAVFYKQENGTWLTAYSPNPPTPEAVQRAQFVDKTYKWAGK